MKTKDKIKSLCRKKYDISLTDYEKKLGFGNGSLSKNGCLRSDRLFTVARDLGVDMESLMDDDIIGYVVSTTPENEVLSSVEIEIIDSYRKADRDMQRIVQIALKLKQKKDKSVKA